MQWHDSARISCTFPGPSAQPLTLPCPERRSLQVALILTLPETAPFSEVRRRVAEQLQALPTTDLRFWRWAARSGNVYRPAVPVLGDMALTVSGRPLCRGECGTRLGWAGLPPHLSCSRRRRKGRQLGTTAMHSRIALLTDWMVTGRCLAPGVLARPALPCLRRR